MKYNGVLAAMATLMLAVSACGQNSDKPVSTNGVQASDSLQGTQRKESEFVSDYITPTRVMIVKGGVTNPDQLLKPYAGQVTTTEKSVVNFRTTGGVKASVLLDFGVEMQGGLQIVRAISASQKPAVFRVCFGESVSEALSDVNAEGSTATNDHAMRDFEISVPWLGAAEYGNTGFRFVRLDLVSEDVDVPLVAVRAISRYRNIPQLGSFKCSDDRLNEIWSVGARTVHLNMQDYVWDGIKRDRLVWIGDMYPEVLAINTVFGNHKVVQKSLDFVRDGTPPTGWMNGMCAYSMWWILIQHHLYMYYGDKEYLESQHSYMRELFKTIIANTDGSKEKFVGGRFVDWPTAGNNEVIHAGLQAIAILALDAGADIGGWLGDAELRDECMNKAAEMRKYIPDPVGNKQAASLMSIAGLLDPDQAAEIVMKDGAHGFSSFLGYFMVESLAKDGKYAEAMDLISEFWGKMLDLGATTFWENFDYDVADNAGRIDEVVPEGKFDIHADGGANCYVGLRQSLCHGWAAGPTAWLTNHVLGVTPAEPGFGRIKVDPHLGNLEWAEGTIPTPYGIISVKVTKDSSGKAVADVKAPRGIKIEK